MSQNTQIQTVVNTSVQAIESGKDDDNRFLTFQISGDVFGIQILSIKEIIEYTKVCSVPMAPAYIRGVINLRGNVVPVIDLANRLGMQGNDAVTERSCVVIIEVEYEDEIIDIGIVVDAVNKVYSIDPNEIDEAPAFGSRVDARFILGMGHVNNDVTVLLNLDRVLDIN